mgnify:FL=1
MKTQKNCFLLKYETIFFRIVVGYFYLGGAHKMLGWRSLVLNLGFQQIWNFEEPKKLVISLISVLRNKSPGKSSGQLIKSLHGYVINGPSGRFGGFLGDCSSDENFQHYWMCLDENAANTLSSVCFCVSLWLIFVSRPLHDRSHLELSLIHISEPTRLC